MTALKQADSANWQNQGNERYMQHLAIVIFENPHRNECLAMREVVVGMCGSQIEAEEKARSVMLEDGGIGFRTEPTVDGKHYFVAYDEKYGDGRTIQFCASRQYGTVQEAKDALASIKAPEVVNPYIIEARFFR